MKPKLSGCQWKSCSRRSRNKRPRNKDARRSQLKLNDGKLAFKVLLLAVSILHVTRAIDEEIEMQPFLKDDKEPEITYNDISTSQIRFALTLYKAYTDVEPGFFALPVAGIFAALSQLYYGTEGEAQRQLSNVLNYTLDSRTTELGLKDFSNTIDNLWDDHVRIKSAIFHAYESRLEDSFEKKLEEIFRSAPRQVDSRDDLKNGKAIHEWMGNFIGTFRYNYTFEREKSLVLASAAEISSTLLDEKYTVCDLTSTAYYYNYPTIDNYEFVRTQAVFNYGELSYRRHDGDDYATAQYIVLPWKNTKRNKRKTILMLPNDKNDISDLEKSVNEATIHLMLSNDKTQLLDATLPKYVHFESVGHLNEALVKIGLTKIYEKSEAFRKMKKDGPTMVSEVVSLADIFHEWYDASKTCDDSIEGVAKLFTANHVFIILTVVEDRNPFILYIGRYGLAPDARYGIIT